MENNYFGTDKKYQIIYADPAWEYDDKMNAGNRGASHKYDLMSDEDIYNMPVNEIADENCILFLWVTFPKIKEALTTIERWGFEYKTIGFIWVKANKKAMSSFWGNGSWTRSNSEPCFIGIKGKPKRIDAGVHSVIFEPHSGNHSEKPNEARKRILKLLGDIPRIELFSRHQPEGWDVWGNEKDKKIIKEYSRKLSEFMR